MSQTNTPMKPTGERMVPESAHLATFWEHVYRYRFAKQFVKGQRVLDIASGEGYGLAALLAAGASQAIGVDISEEACRHAREKYKLDARAGSAESIPLDDHSIDVITSYETIEHVASPSAFLAECCRVLKPGGRIVLSTPLRETYGLENDNEFHVSEMTEHDSAELLRRYFVDITFYAQRPHSLPSWQSDRAGTVWTNFVSRLSLRAGRTECLYGTKRWRDRPAEAILSSAGNRLPLNPYRVRPRNAFGSLGPQYLIAVAKTPTHVS